VNAYAYAGDDPVDFVDQSGLCICILNRTSQAVHTVFGGLAAHAEEIVPGLLGCATGAEYGATFGTAVPALGTAAGGVGGCLVGAGAFIYGGETAFQGL
jgi:hypothetical protein